MFANLVTLTNTDTGNTLTDLLVAAGANMPRVRRVASLKVSIVGLTEAYLVPNTGAYTTTVGNVPDQYGWDFLNMGTWFEMAYPSNNISLDDIIIGGVTGATLAVYGFDI